jgi:hypothetical protein
MQGSFGVNLPSDDVPLDAGNSFLQAWDPVTQKQAWRAPNPGLFNGGGAPDLRQFLRTENQRDLAKRKHAAQK